MAKNSKPKLKRSFSGPDAKRAQPRRQGDPDVAGAGRTAQISFRVRPELKSVISDEARRRQLTVQALILTALRECGLPILEADVEDARKGAPASARRRFASLGAKSRVSARPAYPEFPEIQDFLEHASGRPDAPTVVIVNYGCGVDPRSLPANNPAPTRKR